MKAFVSTEGYLELPAELRATDGILAGQEFEIQKLEPGQYLLKKVSATQKPSLLAWLQSCPSHDWFTPMESESTDTLMPGK